MNNLLEHGNLSEQKINENFAYNFENDCILNQMEYKVMHSQGNSDFVKCMSMLFNGKTQLLYMPGESKTLKVMARGMDEEDFITLVANLLGCISQIKKNGFLSCQNIDVSDDKIYIDAKTFHVKLVYVPIQPKLYEDYGTFENELRMGLSRLINSEFNMRGRKIQQLYYDLYDGAVKLEEIYEKIKIKDDYIYTEGTDRNSPHSNLHNQTRLISVNAPMHMEIKIEKDVTAIGRNATMSDVVITYNGAIGRRHCTIIKNGQQLMIKDENSVNGTYVNDIRIMPGQIRILKDGDLISLANSKFKVVSGES